MDLNDPVDVLARTIWGEARGELYGGRVAIANVVMNRAKNPGWWGKSAVEVCLKPQQFSCWNADDVNYPKLQSVTPTDPIFTESLVIASRAVLLMELEDVTMGSDHYHNLSVTPRWSMGRTPIIQIGQHRFYKLGLKGA